MPIRFYALLCFWFALASIEQSALGQSHTFLIQDKWGVIVGITVSANGTALEPKVVRGMMDSAFYPLFADLEASASGGYQLLSNGFIVPLGHNKMPLSFWTPAGESSRFTVSPDNQGAWIASGFLVKAWGRPPQVVLPPFQPDQPISDLEYEPNLRRLDILFQSGRIALCYPNRFEWLDSLALQDDEAIDFEWSHDSFYVLTSNTRVYKVGPSGTWESLQDIPELGTGLACNLEMSPFGTGFYILDVFGVIHACHEAPPVPTSPLPQDAAVDLEIVPLDSPPQWFPDGWNTEAGLQPKEIAIDPSGPSKTISLFVDKAENLSGFVAEIHFDPSLFKIDPQKVQMGDWWEKSIQSAHVSATIDAKNGSLQLYGGGSYFPFTGATGKGEVARFAIAPITKIKSVTTSIDLVNFYINSSFFDANPGILYRSAKTIQSVSVAIQPLVPHASLVWFPTTVEGPRNIRPGELVRADLKIENGSRIQDVTFGFRFSTDSLRFLGMTLGESWSQDVAVEPLFGLPSEANRRGGLDLQRIHAETPGACKDEEGALVSFFFAAIAPGEGSIAINQFSAQDGEGNNLRLEVTNQQLLFFCR